ncbi:MAG: type II CRISPR-associated endonuclease Cas1 [Thiomicrorhabdus sp.]|nr:type II CRISPR-associated endonuclease Cas1 [Thiomicrorhabdus sp.]
MAWRTLLITRPGYLSYKQQAMVIKQDEGEAKIALEDIAAIVLDNAQITITAQLLSALANQNIALISVDNTHTPNGIFLSYLPHSRALKVLRRQMELGKVHKKQLWQTIIQQKIRNQASVLKSIEAYSEAILLENMANKVKSGDPQNHEAQASQKYFKTVFGKGFIRRNESIINAALNYGYSIIRSAIARQLVAYGFLPALGLQHKSEQNSFNLADDLIEPYRPYIDYTVIQLIKGIASEQKNLTTEMKAVLVEILHKDVLRIEATQELGESTILALIEATVISLTQRLVDKKNSLVLPGVITA